ncbi:MAG: M48 family metallopeptidase [Chitinispirillaceae bacterium]
MSTRKTALLSSFLLILFCARVPVTERQQLQLVAQSELLALSQEQYARVRDSIPVVSGTQQADLVKNVGSRIRTAVEEYLKERENLDRIENFQWEYALFRDTVPNAWAMPGAEIGIHTGILPVTQDELGMAVVMGHEIAHAVAHHGNERMSQLLLLEMGGMALSEALSEQPDFTRSLAMVAFGLGAQLGILLPYSRLHESEADRLGMIFMAMAGYDPREALSFWQRMEEMKSAGQPPEFLSTHPSDQSRIENIKEILPEALEYYNP